MHILADQLRPVSMSLPAECPKATEPGRAGGPAIWLRRLAPLAAVAGAMAAVFYTGLNHQFSIDAIAAHRAAIETFVMAHWIGALTIYVGIYVGVVALSIPAAAIMTITGGMLFGTMAGGLAAIGGGSLGAIIIFLIARSAVGEWLTRRAGSRAARLAAGFRADAFSYLLFLRLVPLFPFWLVNLVPAMFGVSLATFAAATVLGVAPASFAFAFFGASLDTAIAQQEAMKPQLLGALALLGLLALIPALVRRFRARTGRAPH